LKRFIEAFISEKRREISEVTNSGRVPKSFKMLEEPCKLYFPPPKDEDDPYYERDMFLGK